MPSSPALLPEGEGGTWPVGSGFVEAGGGPDGTRWRPGAWRQQPYGDPGFRFTSSGLRVLGVLGPCLAHGRPHPRPFSRREKGALGRWAQILSRPVVARMERGGGRGRGVNNLTGIPDSVSLRPGYGLWVRVWSVVALIPSPSPGGRREHLAGGLRFYRDRWWSGWNAVEAGGVASQAYGESRIPFHSVRATGPAGFGSVFGSWSPSSPALLPLEMGALGCVSVRLMAALIPATAATLLS